MSLLFRTVMTSECTCLNHLLAMDALRHLQCRHSSDWVNLFSRYFEEYLSGSTAPDRKIKDFSNQVYFVKDRWGGADQLALQWYERTVEAMADQQWKQAVYCAAVTGHYFCDAVLPFHTEFTREGMAIHAPADWSIASCYGQLQRILGEDYPKIDSPQGHSWISDLAKQRARKNVEHNQRLVDHFSLSAASRSPHLGFDQDGKECLADIIGSTVVCLSRIIDTAIDESKATPPDVNVGMMGLMSTATKPFAWFSQWLANRKQRSNTKNVLRELDQTNRLVVALSEPDREILELFSTEVLDQPVESIHDSELGEIGEKYGTGNAAQNLSLKVVAKLPANQEDESPTDLGPNREVPSPIDREEGRPNKKPSSKPKVKVLLAESDPVERTPGLNPKIARRLADLDIHNIGDLLDEEPADLATQLNMAQVDSATVSHWQASAELVCSVPRMQPHYAQILVACGITSPPELAEFDPETLLELIEPFLRSTEGQQMLDGNEVPTTKEVGNWIKCAIFAERRAA